MTTHVLEQLPLWVEGDLDCAATAQVRGHLETCPTCRAAAEALRESQAWLKMPEPLPFTAEERAALRSAVMAEVRRDTRKAKVQPLRPLLFTAAAIGLGFLVLSRFHRPVASLSPSAIQAPTVARATVSLPTPEPDVASVPRKVRRPGPALDPIPAGSGLSRIELQTDNPQIRIIWLAKCEPAPEPTPDVQTTVHPTIPEVP